MLEALTERFGRTVAGAEPVVCRPPFARPAHRLDEHVGRQVRREHKYVTAMIDLTPIRPHARIAADSVILLATVLRQLAEPED